MNDRTTRVASVLLMGLLVSSAMRGEAAAHTQTTTPVAGAIRGVVIDDRTGTPIDNAIVRLPARTLTTTTDKKGAFVFDAVPVGSQELTVSVVGYILVKRTIDVTSGAPVNLTVALAAGTGTYKESVTVTAEPFAAREPAVPGQHVLNGAELQNLRGVMLDDAMRAVQALPGVNATDDLHSIFAVRGSDFTHLSIVVDGVQTRHLLHTVEAVDDGGSTAMINGDVLERVALLSGAYPERFGQRAGAQVEFDIRPGSRDRTSARIGISGSSASFVSEGPLGGASRNGSWLVSVRKSYLDFLISQIFDDPSFAFGFTDLQAKIVRDLSSRHQIQATLVAGRSALNEQDTNLGPNELFTARTKGWLGSVAWRTLVGNAFTMTQRVYATGGAFRNVNSTGVELDGDTDHEVGYRADVTYAPRTSVAVEAGGQVGHEAETRKRARRTFNANDFVTQESLDAAGTSASAYGQVLLRPTHRVTVVPGVRFDRWATIPGAAASPWIAGELRIDARTKVTAGTGIYRQPPQFVQVDGLRGNSDLVPEHARHYDVGIERELSSSTHAGVTIYRRDERDMIDLPDSRFRMVNGVIIPPSDSTQFVNVLRGQAHGVELLLQRRTPNGVSGWVAYSYGHLQYTDTRTGETFAGDLDERHSLNAYVNWRLSTGTSLVTKFRASSNLPIPGYYRQQEDAPIGPFGSMEVTSYYLSDRRNTERLPVYSRLDLRVNQTFARRSMRLTLFAEVSNVYNRANLRAVGGDINGLTGRVSGLTEKLFPILPSAGLLIEF